MKFKGVITGPHFPLPPQLLPLRIVGSWKITWSLRVIFTWTTNIDSDIITAEMMPFKNYLLAVVAMILPQLGSYILSYHLNLIEIYQCPTDKNKFIY